VRRLVYIAYLDDSGSTGNHVDDPESPFQVVTAVIIRDASFRAVEKMRTLTTDDLEALVPKDEWRSFEFKATQVYGWQKPFDALGRDKCRQIFSLALSVVQVCQLPVVYGAVDKAKHRAGPYANHRPIDVAFRFCAAGVEKWLRQNGNDDIALLISDDTSDVKEKESIKTAFRQLRKKLRFRGGLDGMDPGPLQHMVDDIYFGDSKDSLGIQIADMCGFIIRRHLSGKTDSEYLYDQIKDDIYFGKVVP
jgi:hypothetical protein